MDTETPPTYTEAILTCLEAGIPVVAAIGNEGAQTTGSPGNDLFALSVGGTDPHDRVAGVSGGRTLILRESDSIEAERLPLPYSKPELSAPGVAIYSAVPGGAWKAFNGTSMATPHVAGGIALLLSATKIQQLGIEVLPVERHLLPLAASLSQLHGLLTNAAITAATMQDQAIVHLASHDTDFDRVPGITRYAPV